MSPLFSSHDQISKLRYSQFLRIIKFLIVGFSGLLVNEGLLWLFTEIFRLYYIFSSIIAIETSIISNFIINSFWTWDDKPHRDRFHFFIRLLKYHVVTGIAALIGNVFILWILTTYFNVYYLVSNLFGIVVGSILNFVANHFWTFAEPKE